MSRLAATCFRSDDKQEYDQLSAAQHQLEGAIVNLYVGNWPAAITLAGAAEDILPPHQQYPDVITVARKDVAGMFGITAKAMVDVLNEKRNWLKHDKSKDPDAEKILSFTQLDAVIMILRGLTRFAAYHAPIHPNEVLSECIASFQIWLGQNYSDIFPLNDTETPK